MDRKSRTTVADYYTYLTLVLELMISTANAGYHGASHTPNSQIPHLCNVPPGPLRLFRSLCFWI
ncbi:hypothetical protein SAICODRAFT_191142 [Saitoella complicata NRRL Y-17804]|uniref:uncharacterized protein n=1 Tax=Saitoella complicata (strain BCRC 22490 / CBS 7301 / JCM 7358 / NBRC 10748 / NRRL Y-17804) TaxID=698492 RepID=UPI000866D6CC|nr:uncharacterized protein SAICODRAFT_191142 [Saitoella complicata NRRL Y-17804]ODQ49798.1 hypothetical protein SAICODRAFT_191142 [Saitoella complicata NRRL Y-17804]